jgi:hypothetical protein
MFLFLSLALVGQIANRLPYVRERGRILAEG